MSSLWKVYSIYWATHRQRGRKGKGVVFANSTTTLIARSRFDPHPGHVIASLDKTLYDHYLCLVASNKQQVYVKRSQTWIGKFGIRSTSKRVRIIRLNQSTTIASYIMIYIAIYRMEDNYGSIGLLLTAALSHVQLIVTLLMLYLARNLKFKLRAFV